VGAANPAVAHTKFDREVEQLRDGAAHFWQKGVFLLEADYPTVLVAFAAPQLTPPALVMAVRFDYSDFDLKPPSVRFVNPFTGTPYAAAELPTLMLRSVEQPLGDQFPVSFPAQAPGGEGQNPPEAGDPAPRPFVVTHQPLIQSHEGGVPFLCVPGVREFHEHPGHTGQPWELERPTGAGGLVRLVELIHKYAIEPIGGWSVNLVPQVALGLKEPPR
jgi:hypothetical protein